VVEGAVMETTGVTAFQEIIGYLALLFAANALAAAILAGLMACWMVIMWGMNPEE
jgi:hypothetical protein